MPEEPFLVSQRNYQWSKGIVHPRVKAITQATQDVDEFVESNGFEEM